MSKVRQHYELAKEGKASQDCDEELGPTVPKTDWDVGTKGGGESSSPHRVEKESHRG
jgi:hypothetical protein